VIFVVHESCWETRELVEHILTAAIMTCAEVDRGGLGLKKATGNTQSRGRGASPLYHPAPLPPPSSPLPSLAGRKRMLSLSANCVNWFSMK